jgi:hypothetical protein
MYNQNGPVDRLIAGTPGWRGATFARLREIIREADPEIAEDAKWKRPSNPLGAAVWSHSGMVAIGGILKDRVRLTLVAGSVLPDPERLFNAMLNGKSRAIDFGEGVRINAAALKALIRAGVALNLAKTKQARARRNSVQNRAACGIG